MRRHWKKLALLLAATAIAASVLFALLSREPEPSYQGRSLTQWATAYPNNLFPGWLQDPQEQAEADALLHMGTNVFPLLTKWAVAEPPKWSKPLDFLCGKFPSLRGNGLVASVYSKANRQPMLAQAAFVLLGTKATPALPELARIAADTQKTNQAAHATQAIDTILVALPLPVLNTLLTNRDPTIRARATKRIDDLRNRHKMP